MLLQQCFTCHAGHDVPRVLSIWWLLWLKSRICGPTLGLGNSSVMLRQNEGHPLRGHTKLFVAISHNLDEAEVKLVSLAVNLI